MNDTTPTPTPSSTLTVASFGRHVKRTLIIFLLVAMALLTISAASASVTDALWVPEKTTTKTITLGETASFDWYASTAWYGLTVDIDLYTGATHVADLASETLGSGYGGGQIALTSSLYKIPGTYTVKILSNDALGYYDLATLTLIVKAIPVPLTADFTWSPAAPTTATTVQFLDASSGPVTSYSWLFGDGTASTAKNPTHRYTAAGDYTVTLTVTGNGKTATAQHVVKVTDSYNDVNITKVIVTATPNTGTAPLSVSFTCAAVGGNAPLSYQWSFGDGSTSSVQNPTHVYTATDTYVATCTVTDNDGDTGSGSATVKATPADVPITDVSVTATPTAGTAPLSVSFTCAAVGGDAPLSYAWTFGDGFTSSVQNPTHTYASNGTYVATCTATDADGDDGSDSATVKVSPATIDHLITKVTVTATPNAGTIPLSVSFTCTATGGDAPLSYQWAFGDGFQSWTKDPTHVYTAADTYVATCTVTDTDGDTGAAFATITANNPPHLNHPPVIQPVLDESVLEKHAYTRTFQVSDPDGDSVSCFSSPDVQMPSWLTLNPATCTLSGVAPAVDADQTFLIKVGAIDSHGATASVSYQLTVVDVPVVPPLVFDEFGCNPDVVQGQIEYCSVRVTDGKNPVSGVLVTFTYVDPVAVDGEPFGTCMTNTKGYCSATAVVNYAPGLYTLEATGSKAGFIAPVPVRDTFRVWKERYSIVGLETFSDNDFSVIEDTFYRGEDLYVSFAVRDQTNGQYVCDSSIVRQAFLRVQNKDPLQLTAVTDASWLARVEGSIRAWMSNLLGGSVSCTYQYWLPAIPLSDDYLGEGMVFAFSFNFQDDTAGQASKDVTVLNNELSFNPPNPVTITKRTIGSSGSTTIDLAPYTADLETPDSEIVYTISVGPVNGGAVIVDELGPGRYSLTAPAGVTDGTTTMILTADDTDGSVVTKTVTLSIVISNGAAPIADLGSDRTAYVDTAVRFDGSDSYDPDGGEIVSYAWSFGDGTTLVTSVPFATKSYADVGVYTVTLTVTDDEGMTGTASVLVTASVVPFIPECSDGKDNDNDDLIDMDDPGCEHPGGADEGHHLRGTGAEHGLDVLDVTFDAYGDEVIVTVVVENEISDRLEDLRVTVEIPELGVKQKGPMFDIRAGRKATSEVVVFLPSGTPAGSYDVEVSISNDDLRRTVQREMVFE